MVQIEYTLLAKTGDARDVICQQCEELKVNMVVVGSRGHGGFAKYKFIFSWLSLSPHYTLRSQSKCLQG